MPDCERCGIFCKTVKSLVKHQKTTKLCQKYQDVIFVCRRCNFNTKGIKNIETHSDTCTGENMTQNPLAEIIRLKQNIEDEKRLLVIRHTQLESKVKNREITIMNLQLKLKFEQMKNKIYADIIQTQTDIHLENIIDEHENEIHVYNFERGNIPIVVHDFVEQQDVTETLIINPPKPKQSPTKKPVKKKKNSIVQEENFEIVADDEEEKKEPKKTYRTVKEYIKTSEEQLDTKLQEDVARVDKVIDKIVYDNFDVSHKDINEQIETLFVQIKESRKYTASLFSIKNLRKKLMGKLNLEEYKSLLFSHINRLEELFLFKKYNQKKIVTTISKALTPLDMRLAHYEGYTNVPIEIDDVQLFGMALDIFVEHQKQFIPYNNTVFHTNVKNYGLSLFELKSCIKRCIINRYGFQNVIYLPRPKSTLKDPYSFYTLISNSPTKRCWKMECRLEDFTTDFIGNVLPFCVSLFRKIYKDVFSDNDYRSDYMNKSLITEFDCEQLLQNIILLSKPMQLCKMIHDIIVSECTFTTTEYDKFDLYGDDKLQQKRFSTIQDDEDESCDVIKQLFDNINQQDCKEVIYNHF